MQKKSQAHVESKPTILQTKCVCGIKRECVEIINFSHASLFLLAPFPFFRGSKFFAIIVIPFSCFLYFFIATNSILFHADISCQLQLHTQPVTVPSTGKGQASTLYGTLTVLCNCSLYGTILELYLFFRCTWNKSSDVLN